MLLSPLAGAAVTCDWSATFVVVGAAGVDELEAAAGVLHPSGTVWGLSEDAAVGAVDPFPGDVDAAWLPPFVLSCSPNPPRREARSFVPCCCDELEPEAASSFVIHPEDIV